MDEVCIESELHHILSNAMNGEQNDLMFYGGQLDFYIFVKNWSKLMIKISLLVSVNTLNSIMCGIMDCPSERLLMIF